LNIKTEVKSRKTPIKKQSVTDNELTGAVHQAHLIPRKNKKYGNTQINKAKLRQGADIHGHWAIEQLLVLRDKLKVKDAQLLSEHDSITNIKEEQIPGLIQVMSKSMKESNTIKKHLDSHQINHIIEHLKAAEVSKLLDMLYIIHDAEPYI
jgi:hypothetical protein